MQVFEDVFEDVTSWSSLCGWYLDILQKTTFFNAKRFMDTIKTS